MTLAQLLSAVQGAPGVLAAKHNTPTQVPGFEDVTPPLHFCELTYFAVLDGVIKDSSVKVGIYDYQGGSEAAYFYRKKPEPLVDNTVEYFSNRTASTITASAIETFCNTVWRSLHAGAPDIRQFNVTPVDGSTVRIEGDFNTGEAQAKWTQMRYYIRLVDPNGSVTPGNANIRFEGIA